MLPLTLSLVKIAFSCLMNRVSSSMTFPITQALGLTAPFGSAAPVHPAGIIYPPRVIFGPGSQFSYIEDGSGSAFGSCNWGVVGTFADVTIGTCFPNSYHQGTYAFVQNVSTIYMNGATMLDDESAGFKTAGLLFAPQVNCRSQFNLERRIHWYGRHFRRGCTCHPNWD